MGDFIEDRISYNMPLTKSEFEKFMRLQTVFKTKDRLNRDEFIKNFFD